MKPNCYCWIHEIELSSQRGYEVYYLMPHIAGRESIGNGAVPFIEWEDWWEYCPVCGKNA
jgi:hypothetical protein